MADEGARPIGLICPRCGCRHFWVTNTEPLRDGRIRRRRECRHCGRRIVTYEAPLEIGKARRLDIEA